MTVYRCASKNTLYPKQKLLRLDCCPSPYTGERKRKTRTV